MIAGVIVTVGVCVFEMKLLFFEIPSKRIAGYCRSTVGGGSGSWRRGGKLLMGVVLGRQSQSGRVGGCR